MRRAQTSVRSPGEGVVKASSASTHSVPAPGAGLAQDSPRWMMDGWVIEGLALPCLCIHFPPVTRPSTLIAVLGTRAPLPRAVGQVSAEEIELGRRIDDHICLEDRVLPLPVELPLGGLPCPGPPDKGDGATESGSLPPVPMRPLLIQFHVPLTLPPVGPRTPLSRPAVSSHLLPLLCSHLRSPYRPSSSRKLPLATLACRELFCSQDPIALLPLMISSIKHLALLATGSMETSACRELSR